MRAQIILTSATSNGLISYTEVVSLVSLVALTLCNRFIYGEYRHAVAQSLSGLIKYHPVAGEVCCLYYYYTKYTNPFNKYLLNLICAKSISGMTTKCQALFGGGAKNKTHQ